MGTAYVDALRSGQEFPPVVVFRRRRGWSLLDGANRTHAHWVPNLWPLALVSFGESWHNMHDSDPACARHGAEPGQIDISAAVIRVFERLGWATGVHWPVPARLAARRRNPGPGQPPPALQPGGHQRERPAAPARGLSPLPASSDRLA